MRAPIQGTAFAAGFWISSQLHTRFFPKLSYKFYDKSSGTQGIGQNCYLANHDLISKFRIFESGVGHADSQKQVEDYLDVYTSGPLTKAEMLNRLADGRKVPAQFQKKFQFKREGKDADDIFWAIGKIHGLENLALCDPEEIKACGNDPIALQRLVNKANDAPKPLPPGSFDLLVEALHESLAEYKKSVDNFGGDRQLKSSDRKKLLALPFYLSKRVEYPAPKKGQKEYDLFKKLTGNDWNKFEDLEFDKEEKITEFNYENYISKHAIKNIDTQSEDFKVLVKALNFQIKTAYEKHVENQE